MVQWAREQPPQKHDNTFVFNAPQVMIILYAGEYLSAHRDGFSYAEHQIMDGLFFVRFPNVAENVRAEMAKSTRAFLELVPKKLHA
ncbi:hypothetical protein MRX96_008076 [Rhipicephalus microplus]